jgi:hypothetical protein
VPSETPQTRPAALRAPAVTTAQAPRRLGLVLAVIATAQLMIVLDLTIVNVALPHIQAALGFSGSNLDDRAAVVLPASRNCLASEGLGSLTAGHHGDRCHSIPGYVGTAPACALHYLFNSWP